MDIFEKCYNFTDARQARETGLYPYFHALETALGLTQRQIWTATPLPENLIAYMRKDQVLAG